MSLGALLAIGGWLMSLGALLAIGGWLMSLGAPLTIGGSLTCLGPRLGDVGCIGITLNVYHKLSILQISMVHK